MPCSNQLSYMTFLIFIAPPSWLFAKYRPSMDITAPPSWLLAKYRPSMDITAPPSWGSLRHHINMAVHPWTYKKIAPAFSIYRPSMDISAI
ncbi:hypothetical protein JYT79_02250 [Cardiobacterium sp. AH-315-I02]|nr:hypothetical protein [Cardiobacterium sp. AH-315-I02]